MIHSATSNGVQFFLNDPLNPGSFTSVVRAAGHLTRTTNWSLAAADFDGDGDRDTVMVAQGLSAPFAQIFRNNNGLGTSWGSSTHATLDTPLSVDLLDADGDGFTDIAIANTNIGGVSLLLGDGLGGFAAPVLVATGAGGTTVVRAADFNGDGAADLAVGNPSRDAISVVLGAAGFFGTFITPPGDFSTLVRNTDGTFTRRLKNNTTIEYDAAGLMTARVDSNGNTTAYAYDAGGNLTTITDPVGLVTTLAYTGGRLTSVTDPASRVTGFEHDAAGDLVKIVDADLTERLFAYDEPHRMTAQTSKRGFASAYQYGFHGRVVRANRPDGSTNELAATRHLISLSCLRSGLGRAGVLQEPGPTSGGGDIGEVSGRRRGAPEGASSSLRPQRGAGLSPAKSARTRPMRAAPIRRRGFTARARARRAGSATWATR